jgi:hypothetical protein
MTDCSDNLYTIKFTDTSKTSLSVAKGQVVTDKADIALVGKTKRDYGEIFNENTLHLLENFACPEVILSGVPQGIPDTAFTINALLENPIEGQIWYSTTTQRPFKYIVDQGVGEWVQFSTQEDIAGNSGVIADGQPLPRPVSQITGYEFEYDECTWIVTPFNYTEKINFMICSVEDRDSDGIMRVNMKYRPSGKDLVSGSANYQIIGIRGHTNAGTYGELPPTPTPLVQTVPILSDPTTAAIGTTTATLGGTVVSDGASSIIERGIVWGLTASPTIGVDTVVVEGNTTTGVFTVDVTGLDDGRTIYFRAYATNAIGTGYTDGTVNFDTINVPEVPTVVLPIAPISTIIGDQASVGATITSDGGAPIFARGIRWGTDNPPTQNDASAGVGGNGGVDTFLVTITSLGVGETIYFRGYAENSVGEGVSVIENFVSDGTPVIPTVITNVPANPASTTATAGGQITDNGGRTITRRGVVYGETSGGPYTGDVYDGLTTVGNFLLTLTPLNTATTYYFKAYAINSVGTGFGTEESFVTNNATTAPILDVTPLLSGIKPTAATLGGDITNSGGLPIDERGTVWGTSANPTLASAGASRTTKFPEIPSGTIGEFAKEVTGFQSNSTYHFRAYAINSKGTTYSDNRSFTTSLQVVIPTITASHSNLESTSVNIGGVLANKGNGTILEFGIRYGRFQNAMDTVLNTVGLDIPEFSAFGFPVTGILPSTLYYYEAYAINSAGEGTSSIGHFTTPATATVPSLTLYAVNTGTITDDGGTLQARITASGGEPITSYGFYTSTNGGSTWSPPIVVGTSFTNIPSYFYSAQSGFGTSQTVHYKAYATNSEGTTETSTRSFTTASGATIPVVSFAAIAAYCATTADIVGNYVSSGGGTVTEIGVVWGTSSGARTTYVPYGSVPAPGSSYTVGLTGLPGTSTTSDKIYVEMYALNGEGYGYSTEWSFDTATSPTYDAYNMAFGGYHPTIELGSYIGSDNGAPVTDRGFNWGYDSSVPYTAYPPVRTGITLYQATIDTSAGAGGTLFARHFATNCAGTTVGDIATFALGGPPDLGYVGSGYYWDGCELWLRAEVLDYQLGIPLTDYGFEWRYYGDLGDYPMDANNVTFDGRYITGLVLDGANNPPVGGDTIEFRVWAINEFQPFGTPITYGTPETALVPDSPTIGNPPVAVSYNNTTNTAVLQGNVQSLGGWSSVTRGVIYGPTYFSLIEGNAQWPDHFEKAVSGSTSSTGTFNVTLTSTNMANVSGRNPIYFRTWVENGCGRDYSIVGQFTVGDAPAVSTTLAVHEVSDTWARVQGSIISDGGLTVTEYGFEYKKSVNSTWSKLVLGGTPPSYGHVVLADPLGGLTPNTDYDIRTYAINSSDTGRSDIYHFTTKYDPVVDSLSIGTPSESDVSVTARIVSWGNNYFYNTAVGFCYNTSGNPDIDNDTVVISPDSEYGGANLAPGDTFPAVLNGLAANTTYWVRGFADAPYGNVGYTSQQSFTTDSPDTTGDVNNGESALSSKTTLTVCITLAQDGTIRDSNNSQVGTWLLSYPTFRPTEDSSNYNYTVDSVTGDTLGSSTPVSSLTSQINTNPGTLSAGKTFCVVWERVGDGSGNVYIDVTIAGPVGTSPGTVALRIRLLEMFDGGGGGCFAAGTKVMIMVGDEILEKNIELITLDDILIGYDEDAKIFVPVEFEALMVPRVTDTIKVMFDDGTSLHTTADHPFLTDNGYRVVDETLYQKNHATELEYISGTLHVGDTLIGYESNKMITEILESEPELVYHLLRSDTSNFVANGVVAHNIQNKD